MYKQPRQDLGERGGAYLTIQENNYVDWQEDVYKLTYTENQMTLEGLQIYPILNGLPVCIILCCYVTESLFTGPLAILQLNPVISNSQGQRKDGSKYRKFKITDSKWLKDKCKGNGFELEKMENEK